MTKLKLMLGSKRRRLIKMYKIGRLHLSNFKAIEKSLEIDLREIRAAVFDGPNGFGKTTIFDAIEISFTGKIGRIASSQIASDAKARDSHFLKNKHDKPTIIKLELINELDGESFIIKTEVQPGIKGAAASVKKYSDHIKRQYSDNWNSQEWSSLNEAVLASKLKLVNLPSLFPVQHYISQEETTHFLKDRSETDRHKHLSHLFGTVDQSNEHALLEEIKAKVLKVLEELKSNITKATAQREKLQPSNPSAEDGEIATPSGELASVSSLSEAKSVAMLDDYISALGDISVAIKEPTIYRDIKFNKLLDVFETSREQELEDLIKFGSLYDFKEVRRLFRAKRKFEVVTEKIKINKLILEKIELDAANLSDSLLDFLQQKLVPLEKISVEIKRLALLRTQSSGFSKIRTSLLMHSEALLEAYKMYHAETHQGDASCPLCGDFKVAGISQLINEYNIQKEYYERQLSEVDKEIVQCMELIKESYIDTSINKINNFLSRTSWITSSEVSMFFIEKNIDETRFAKMGKLREWLSAQNVKWEELADPKLFQLASDYTNKKNQLKERVSNLRKIIQSIEPSIEMDVIKQGCTTLGIKNDEEMLNISPAGIAKDISYLRFERIKLCNSEMVKLNNEISIMNDRLRNIQKKISSLDEILQIYNESIRKYEIDVASSIAIPLYVYSSKVLKTRLDGTGIFLKTPGGKEKVPYIRFCARKNDTHDAWCTMSSGQLAGLVISFALAMNKLYPSKLQTVLIDDPIQSMDDINSASLIQLFLYEFPTYQFVVSTHEQKSSSYMSYKFIQGGGKVGKFNMKDIVSN